MKSAHTILLGLAIILLPFACSDEEGMPVIRTLSVTLNGANLVDGVENVPLHSTLVVVFSSAVIPTEFENELSIVPAPTGIDFSYSNQSSKVTIDLVLTPQTSYEVSIGQGIIGQNGGRLEEAFIRSFTTLDNGIIHSLPPCTSASNDCLETLEINANGEVNFYSSFPIFEEMAEWLDLEAAILVVHGANRDANNYFTYMMTSLQAESLEQKVVLIAPYFKNEQEASGNEIFWSNTGWREGNNSLVPVSISSFEVLDRLLEQLADKTHFPVLEKIIVTGHSSGGLFTHLYAAANKSEAQHPELAFEYVVANSQYFYYPDGQRINESTNQLYTPTGCAGYDIFPQGFNVVPAYVSATEEGDFNSRFTSRSVTYLLGNGTRADPTLNTTDCYATLLGSTRYRRGENMFTYMELVYPGGHAHKRIIVPGIGHDGQAMYQSQEFRSLLQQLLN